MSIQEEKLMALAAADQSQTMAPSSPETGGRQKGSVWFVTGCSSGFGSLLVPAIIARGDKVIATSRRTVDISDIPAVTAQNVKFIQLDIADSEDVLQQAVEDAVAAFGSIDVLVNNAGFVMSGVWEELRPEEVKQQFQTNVFGALNLTRVVLPYMRAKRAGTIVFMGSIAGWHGVAAGGPYSASKFALEGAAECLAKEVQDIGISVRLFILGQFRTGILDPNNTKGLLDSINAIPEYADVKRGLALRHSTTQGAQPGDPSLAVEKIIDVVKHQNGVEKKTGPLPLRIPLGSDAVEIMKKKCEETTRILDEWAGFSCSTDFPGEIAATPGYYR